ncbi:MAG: glycosyltransferase family 39 protein [Ruminococcaceae bacterium]|nr:glycosyltransferase family 39 protein [Oscillospiraceae bacterium]
MAHKAQASIKKPTEPQFLSSEKTGQYMTWICFAIMALGFILRLYYTHLTAYNISKHDLGYVTGLSSEKLGSGHLGYIEYITREMALPNFNPTSRWSFYNPPFFHATAAVLLGFFHMLGIPDARAWELVQYLPCVAIFFSVIGVYKILKLFDIKGVPMMVGLALVSFHPTLSYLSLALNNDAMSFMFTIWAVYFAICWYREPKKKTIVYLALAIGLGMMTKLTVALIAPPVALLFAVRFFKDKKWMDYIKQFAIFLAICVPTGLFWGIRNLWLYDLPITYVQALPENSGQNVSGFTMAERFGWPAWSDFLRLDASWSKPTPDHNIWSQTLRTALFDDNALTWETEEQMLKGKILMVLTLGLFFLLTALTVWGLIRAKQQSPLLRTFIAFAAILIMGNFVKFCMDYPMTCTIHFRYIAPVLLYGSIGLGFWWESTKKKIPARIILAVVALAVLTTCVISTELYTECLPVLEAAAK